MSFDLVSYAAGLTSMAFIPFFIATGIGQLPATIISSYVGGMLSGGSTIISDRASYFICIINIYCTNKEYI